MDFQEITALVESCGGTIRRGINWTWALFTDDKAGQQCLATLRERDPQIEDRGYYAEHGFRFR